MGWFQRSRQLARETDPLFSWGERIVKVVWPLVGPFVVPAVTGLLLGAVGWFTEYPLFGVLIGLAAWALMQIISTARVMRKKAASELVVAPGTQDTTTEYPPPNPLPPDAASKPYLSDLSFRITEQADKVNPIRQKTFEGCVLHGPAMLLPMGISVFQESTFAGDFAGDLDSMFWEVDPTRRRAMGPVGLQDCTFRRCTFVGIGILGTPDVIRDLKNNIRMDQFPVPGATEV